MMRRLFFAAALLPLLPPAHAAEHLVLNPHLDYSSDSNDGPLITGTDMDSVLETGKPNYVIIYGEGCYNSKHQARRTVELYQQFAGRVHFVAVDLDQRHSVAQDALIQRFYQGSIPHVVVLDGHGSTLYNQAGEVENASIAALLQKSIGAAR